MSDSERTTRREVFKKAAFVTPIILTFPAIASFARAGSNNQGGNNQGGSGNNNQDK